MAKFLLVREQDGDFDDYTIRCGEAVDEIEAADIVEAQEYLHQMVLHPEAKETEEAGFFLEDDEQVSRARLYQVSAEYALPLEQWRRELTTHEIAEDAKTTEAQERAELERLQKKYDRTR